jgi:septal ring factor EnvC (AmiA/AmiB activator)
MSTEGDSGIPATTEASIYETTQEMTASAPTTPLPEVAPSNAETMAAQALSKIKKQAQEIEKTKKAIAKMTVSAKKAEKGLAAHEKQQNQKIKKLSSQISQLQKQLAKSKSTGKKLGARKKKKAKPKKR